MAAVIVTVVLLATLTALLMFYLKNKQRESASTQGSRPSDVIFTGFDNDLYASEQTVSSSIVQEPYEHVSNVQTWHFNNNNLTLIFFCL